MRVFPRRYGLIIAVLVAFIGFLIAIVWTSPEAKADWLGGSVRHYSPDQGYDEPIKVIFDNGDVGYVREGGHSDHLQPNGQEDVNKVCVGANLELSRFYSNEGAGAFEVWFEGPGCKNLGDTQNALMVVGRG